MKLYRAYVGGVNGIRGEYQGIGITKLIEAINVGDLDDFHKGVLIYGYFWEFVDEEYETKSYTIDNAVTYGWEVTELTTNKEKKMALTMM